MRDVYVGALISSNYLKHYGIGPDDNPPGRGSGRYPKGYGERPFQHVTEKSDYQFASQPLLSRLIDAITPVTKSAVKKRYDENLKNNRYESTAQKTRLKRAGIDTSNPDYHILKAGSVVGRYSSRNDEGNVGRKYVFVTSVDENAYKQAATNSGLGFSNDKRTNIYRYELKAAKDLKIAKASDVQKYIFDTYHDAGVQKTYEFLQEIDHNNAWKTTSNLMYRSNTIRDWKIGNYVYRGEQKVADFFNKNVYDPVGFSRISDHFKKEGYDAIVDPEDEVLNYSYPLIVLEPQKTLETIKVHKLKR